MEGLTGWLSLRKEGSEVRLALLPCCTCMQDGREMQPSTGTSKAPVHSGTLSSPLSQLTKLPTTGLFKQLTIKGLVG